MNSSTSVRVRAQSITRRNKWKGFPCWAAHWAALMISPANAQSVPERSPRPAEVDPGVYSGRVKVNYPTAIRTGLGAGDSRDIGSLAWVCRRCGTDQRPERRYGEKVDDLDKLPAHISLARTDLQIQSYEWGVTYAGMLRAAEVLGDPKYRDYTDTEIDCAHQTRVACQTKSAQRHHGHRVPSAKARHGIARNASPTGAG